MLKLPHFKLPQIRQETAKQLIFTVARIGGPALTAILGIEAGKKIQKAKIEMLYLEDPDDPDPQTNGLYFEELSKGEQAKIIIPKLIPPLAAAGITIGVGCIDKHIDAKRIAEMTGLYSTALASAQIYRQKLLKVDPEAAKEADESVGQGQIKVFQKDSKEVVEHAAGLEGKADTIFVDTLTGREFLSTPKAVQDAIEEAKGQYVETENIENTIIANTPDSTGVLSRYLSMNDFYDLLGIRRSHFGQEFGFIAIKDRWSEGQWSHGDEELDISIVQSKKDQKTYYIEYGSMPIEGWYAI